MKKVKQVNGYIIYQSTTQRDVDNYHCEIGNYNIYIASDIRDFGLANNYAEWEDEDSLAVAIARCNGSQYAVACALADELSDSTVQDMDLVQEIERRLEAGEALETIRESYDTDGQCFDDELLDGDLEDVLDQAMTEPTEYRVHSFYAGMTGYSITCGGKEVYFGYSCDEVVERFGFNPNDIRYDENNDAVVVMGADQPSEDQPNRYLAVISWEDNGKTETCYSIKSPEEIFSRIDMYDCYEEDLTLWLLTPEGPQPCDWHGTWHDCNDPLKMSITLRSTGNVLDLAWGTDH